jgi:hypothetical protein
MSLVWVSVFSTFLPLKCWSISEYTEPVTKKEGDIAFEK